MVSERFPRGGRPVRSDNYPLLPVALLAQASLDGYLGENALRFCEHQSSPHPPTTICHEVGGGSPTEEFLIFVLFIFFGHRPTTPGCRAKATHCWPAQAPSEKGDTVLIRPGVQYQSKV